MFYNIGIFWLISFIAQAQLVHAQKQWFQNALAYFADTVSYMRKMFD